MNNTNRLYNEAGPPVEPLESAVKPARKPLDFFSVLVYNVIKRKELHMEQQCSQCLKWFPIENFPKNRYGVGGRLSQCNTCAAPQRGPEHRVFDGIGCKYCHTCKQWLPLTQFYRRKASGDGLAYTCKTCALEDARRRRAAHSTGRGRGRPRGSNPGTCTKCGAPVKLGSWCEDCHKAYQRWYNAKRRWKEGLQFSERRVKGVACRLCGTCYVYVPLTEIETHECEWSFPSND